MSEHVVILAARPSSTGKELPRRMSYPTAEWAESSARSHARQGTATRVLRGDVEAVRFTPARWVTHGLFEVREERA